ncbi:hypothetical protein SASPL_135194 [Salvia splendens]|uniref:peroxidase n=1 Tax=Salvia splendens TaxID=180675 RepID=A0A8X8WYB6_SALSN|nr:hypothetical protein SASPL_135194 [Salvia splendens]
MHNYLRRYMPRCTEYNPDLHPAGRVEGAEDGRVPCPPPLPRLLRSERTALQNANSVRGFEVVEAAKQAVEAICPSCAEVLAVAARDATVAAGGPSWTVNLGRRDSPAAATRALAENDLPRSTNPLSTLISNLANKNLNVRDLVALSGSHTIGQARCVNIRDRIYDNASIDPDFVITLRRIFPQPGGDRWMG